MPIPDLCLDLLEKILELLPRIADLDLRITDDRLRQIYRVNKFTHKLDTKEKTILNPRERDAWYRFVQAGNAIKGPAGRDEAIKRLEAVIFNLSLAKLDDLDCPVSDQQARYWLTAVLQRLQDYRKGLIKKGSPDEISEALKVVFRFDNQDIHASRLPTAQKVLWLSAERQ
jgi:hypothetical protein